MPSGRWQRYKEATRMCVYLPEELSHGYDLLSAKCNFFVKYVNQDGKIPSGKSTEVFKCLNLGDGTVNPRWMETCLSSLYFLLVRLGGPSSICFLL